MPKESMLCCCIALAEFDLKKGNVLSFIYPEEYKLPRDNMEDYCFMDGAHLYQEDMSYMVFPADANHQLIYGTSIYYKYKSNKVERGAIQKALLILSSNPYYKEFTIIGKAFLKDFIVKDAQAIHQGIRDVFGALNQSQTQIVWNTLRVPIPKSPSIQHVAQINELVRRFKKHLMLLWYAVIMGKRIMVVGKPAHIVGACVLAIPDLISPMIVPNIESIVTPYVALTDLNPIEKDSFIAGATNELFEHNQQWWDVCASFQTGTITQQSTKIKLSKKDKQFMKSLLSGINDGRDEQWTRTQFRLYTEQSLNMITKKRKKNKAVQKLVASSIYQNYMNTPTSEPTLPQPAISIPKRPLSIDTVTKSAEDEACDLLHHLNDKEDPKLPFYLYKLSNQIQDLTQLTSLISHNAIPIIGEYITHDKVQVRKYAASILAAFAVTVNGQDALIRHEGIIQHILNLVQDALPNVRYASIYCLMKITTWKKGVMLVHQLAPQISNQLYDLIFDPTLDVQIVATGTLINLLPLKPDSMDTNPFMDLLIKTVNKQLRHHLIVLLDRLGVNFLPNQLFKDQSSVIESLSTDSQDDATEMLRAILMETIVDVSNTNTYMIELLACDIVPLLLSLEKQADPSADLSVLSCQLLKNLVLDTSAANRQLVSLLPNHISYWHQHVFTNENTTFHHLKSEEDIFDLVPPPPNAYLVSIVEILTHLLRYDFDSVFPLFLTNNFSQPFFNRVLGYYQEYDIPSIAEPTLSTSPSLHQRLRHSPLRHFTSASPPSPASPSSPRLLIGDDSDLSSFDIDSGSLVNTHSIQLIASIIECFSYLIDTCSPEQLVQLLNPIHDKLSNAKTYILDPLSTTILQSKNHVHVNMYLRLGQIIDVFLDHVE